MLNITEDDILYAEKILLPPGESFNNERREIIKSLNSIDIKASPGSGKTTTLLAKLAILTTMLPLDDNKGICILTHTNVAINEIKDKLNVYGQSLFEYPNNCSTIQLFVNKFLAIPAYIHFYGKKPIRIDNQIYEERIMKKYYQIIPRRLRYGIEKRSINIKTIRFDLSDGTLKKDLYGTQIYKSQQSESYKALKELKDSVMMDGILSYDDAYFLAINYIKENPDLKKIFSIRFPYVFIDEMQDTMDHQQTILDYLFDESVVIQRIGDPNQSIYDQRNATGTWEISQDRCREITDSKRFSTAVAKAVQNICVQPQQLIGNPEIEDIKPCILVFKPDRIDKVLPYFSKVIVDNNLHLSDKKIFKAIGWVSEHEKEIGISNYWNDYIKEVKQKVDFNYLNNYLLKASVGEVDKYGSRLYKERIIRGILKALRQMEQMNEDRFFTETSFLDHLRISDISVYNKLLLMLSKWCLKIQNDENVFLEVKEFIIFDLKELFNWEDTGRLDSFFENQIEDIYESHENKINVYKFNENSITFDINVSTIHSVKGETHTATLYLETYYHDYDVKRIIEYLKGKHSVTRAVRTLQNLKMTYVGMTRPSHLLCVAVTNETVLGHEEELVEAGWDIRYV
ncbi:MULTISPECIES: UvrD-helicase domain-containing protein [unclassified Exiguobacterium]|uniref:UvrD-helicase domain-containing protein n=1 Tax=unclassified Exiguobacterium TaxID=2644629 RepID=UPI001BE8A340|nr:MULTISPECIES: UvrD-helicase domain-containing protein [unclassified Exiguobacterium]